MIPKRQASPKYNRHYLCRQFTMTVSRFLQIISSFLKMVKFGEKNCLPKFVYKIFNLGMGRVRTHALLQGSDLQGEVQKAETRGRINSKQ